jgi:exopolyphosphatase/pppGpp-phosphohydrolase
MLEEARPIRAAIDIGSNTIHIVVARCHPDTLEILADELELVRIGESVNASGAISEEKTAAALEVIASYVELARRLEAQTILLVATEAIRRASNREAFSEQVRARVGLPLLLLSGGVEATLTFYGATYELYAAGRAPVDLGVVDLGGGSTELVSAHDGHITWRTSLPIGSGWLLDRYLSSDPPAYQELEEARRFLEETLRSLAIKGAPATLVATGGSANSLWLLAERAFRLERPQRRLTADDLARCEGLLAALPAEEIAQRYYQPYKRARILPAGAIFLRALMARLGLDEISVSPHGIREGVLLAYERYGAEWLAEIERQSDAAPSTREQDPFVSFGRRLLKSRLEKMLSWHRALLKNNDPEAVHKMRVASRRLRAALDAYQELCDPKLFKKVYRRVKKTAALLGTVRDTDVILARLQSTFAEVEPQEDERLALDWLIAGLEDYRRRQQAILTDYLEEFDEEALRRRLTTCLKKEDC